MEGEVMPEGYLHQYTLIGLLTAVAILLGALPLLLARFVAPRKPGATKQAPYECGLESEGDPWVQFRVQYYIYALLFVVFDVEVVFIYPWAVVFPWARTMYGGIALVEMALFLVILGVGLVYAWRKGLLEWE
jgi:NADH-quinone oxidoreductase subunit A